MSVGDRDRARSLHRAGDLEAAASCYARALAQAPDDWMLRYDYAVLLMQAGAPADAVAVLDAIPAGMRRGEASLLLAVCLRGLGQVDAGLDAAREASDQLPGDAFAWMVRGSLEVGAGRYAEAEASLRRCLSLAPGFAEAWHYLGEAFHRQQRWHEAIDAYRMAAREKPEELFNVAMCAERGGDTGLALAAYRQMAEAYPRNVAVLVRLAQIEARLCLFEDQEATASRIAAAVAGGEFEHGEAVEAFPLTFLPVPEAHKRTLLALRSAGAGARARAAAGAPPLLAADGTGRIRLGYISPDFGAHAVGHLVRDVFAAHDRDRFEVFAYSLREHRDPDGDAIRAGCDHYIECQSLTSQQVAGRIRQDGVDVLIDLGGPTDGAREEILALRPSPLQFGWLGFIHAQEAPWLDAILLDDVVQPAAAQWIYSDRVIRLPGTLFPGSASRPGARTRPAFGLPGEDHVVLASFNNSYKLDRALLRAWSEILERSPKAVLVVYLPEPARPGFMLQWRRVGGDPGRLIVVDTLPADLQADRMASCDLMLDSFRYQGGATTMDAIASGLPVLALHGGSPPARLGASINRHLGLDELVAADVKGYVEAAIELANSPQKLKEIRDALPGLAARHRLFDPRRSAQAIEQVCFQYAARHRSPP